MEIDGLDYNTQRKKLTLPEYGREVQKMVDYAMTLSDREERQKCAETINMHHGAHVPAEQREH